VNSSDCTSMGFHLIFSEDGVVKSGAVVGRRFCVLEGSAGRLEDSSGEVADESMT